MKRSEILAAGTLFFFPLAKMLTLGWVLFFARRGERAPGFATAMTVLHYVGPWTMNEVFVLGAMVLQVATPPAPAFPEPPAA